MCHAIPDSCINYSLSVNPAANIHHNIIHIFKYCYVALTLIWYNANDESTIVVYLLMKPFNYYFFTIIVNYFYIKNRDYYLEM